MSDNAVFKEMNEAIRIYNTKNPEKTINLADINIINQKVDVHVTNNNYKELLEFLNEIEETFPGILFGYLKEYVKMRSSNILAQKDKKEVIDSRGMIDGFIAMVSETKKQMIVLQETSISYNECKRLMLIAIRQYFEDHVSNKNINENAIIYPFLISENINVNGNLVMKRSTQMEMLPLISVTIDKESEDISVGFLGDKLKYTSNNSYSESFYIYTFVSDEKKTYYVLSKKDLQTQHCRIKGMEMDIQDVLKLGNNATANTTISLILATDIAPDINIISENEFLKYTNRWDHEKLAKEFFNELRHPLKFEKLLFAWMFSSKHSGYPLHLLWLGSPGTAKSWTLTALGEIIFNETVIDMSQAASIKALVPSYGSTNIEPGFLVRCTRIACIDEFFRVFKRNTNSDERGSGLLTTCLEGVKRGVASGKHGMLEVKMNARAIMTANPYEDNNDLSACIQKFDLAMMSRLFIYVQTTAHEQFIKARRIALQGKKSEDIMPKYNPRLIELTDFLQQAEMQNLDIQRVYDIYNKYRKMISTTSLQKIYDGRYDHHLLCLLDGIVKYNSIVEGRRNFNVTDKDYEDAEKLFAFCLASWDTSLLEWKDVLNGENKLDHLPLACSDLYHFIKENPNCTMYQAANRLTANPHHWISVLTEWNLIKEESVSENGKSVKRYSPIANQIKIAL